MKRKNLLGLSSLLLVAAMTACGGGSSGDDSKDDKKGGKTDYNILVWCAEKAVDLTTAQLSSFAETLDKEVQDAVNIKFTVNPVSEANAAENMTQDPEKGADVFCFAQDQLARLVAAGALDNITDNTIKADIEARNDAGSVAAAKVGSKLYAFPLTSDNGYFMYYDKSVVAAEHIGNMTQIIADVAAKNKEISFEYGSAWYNAAYFHAFGCESHWTTNEEGKYVSYVDTYEGANAIKALRGLNEIASNPHTVSNSQVGQCTANTAVLVSGTWDVDGAKTLFGENYGVAELPSVTVNNETKHLGSFGGFKLMGAKPQKDAVKAFLCKKVASYLTDEARQLARFKALGWGPSNKNAQQDPDVKADEALNALLKQGEYAVPQGQFPGDWWKYAGQLGTDVSELSNPTDAQLQDILTKYRATLDGLIDAE